MIRRLVFALLLVIGLGFVSDVRAQAPDVDELNAQIAALLAQIEHLQRQLTGEEQNQPPVPAMPVGLPVSPVEGEADIVIVTAPVVIKGLRPGYGDEWRFSVEVEVGGRVVRRQGALLRLDNDGNLLLRVAVVRPGTRVGDVVRTRILYDQVSWGYKVDGVSFEIAPKNIMMGVAIVKLDPIYLGEVSFTRLGSGITFFALPLVPRVPMTIGDLMERSGSTIAVGAENGRLKDFGGDPSRPLIGYEGIVLNIPEWRELAIFGDAHHVEVGALTAANEGVAAIKIPKGISLRGLPFFPLRQEVGEKGGGVAVSQPGDVLSSVFGRDVLVIMPAWGSPEYFDLYLLSHESGPFVDASSPSRAYLVISPEARTMTYWGTPWSDAGMRYDYGGEKGAPALFAAGFRDVSASSLVGAVERAIADAPRDVTPDGKLPFIWGAEKGMRSR